MNDLGVDVDELLSWFPQETRTPYVLIRVTPDNAAAWATVLGLPVRRCYITDSLLQQSATANNVQQSEIIAARLPGPGSTMSGDFGEIIGYLYQGTLAHPSTVLGAAKWRLKQDRTKPAPYSDVVHLFLATWPSPCDRDRILCSEVKTKATNGASTPIQSAIADLGKDRTSRLTKTLVWLRERSLTEDLGDIRREHLERFINASAYPPAQRDFNAVAVVCAGLLDAELSHAPTQPSADYTVVVISVPELQRTYTSVYAAAMLSTAVAPASLQGD